MFNLNGKVYKNCHIVEFGGEDTGFAVINGEIVGEGVVCPDYYRYECRGARVIRVEPFTNYNGEISWVEAASCMVINNDDGIHLI